MSVVSDYFDALSKISNELDEAPRPPATPVPQPDETIRHWSEVNAKLLKNYKEVVQPVINNHEVSKNLVEEPEPIMQVLKPAKMGPTYIRRELQQMNEGDIKIQQKPKAKIQAGKIHLKSRSDISNEKNKSSRPPATPVPQPDETIQQREIYARLVENYKRANQPVISNPDLCKNLVEEPEPIMQHSTVQRAKNFKEAPFAIKVLKAIEEKKPGIKVVQPRMRPTYTRRSELQQMSNEEELKINQKPKATNQAGKIGLRSTYSDYPRCRKSAEKTSRHVQPEEVGPKTRAIQNSSDLILKWGLTSTIPRPTSLLDSKSNKLMMAQGYRQRCRKATEKARHTNEDFHPEEVGPRTELINSESPKKSNLILKCCLTSTIPRPTCLLHSNKLMMPQGYKPTPPLLRYRGDPPAFADRILSRSSIVEGLLCVSEEDKSCDSLYDGHN
uniref:Uncharacterized protein n=1 Tax=Graphocephala atropunctata TaxID=36148 RepID=A0A1B6LSR0_9HEMI